MHSPVILILKRPREENGDFKASLGYKAKFYCSPSPPETRPEIKATNGNIHLYPQHLEDKGRRIRSPKPA